MTTFSPLMAVPQPEQSPTRDRAHNRQSLCPLLNDHTDSATNWLQRRKSASRVHTNLTKRRGTECGHGNLTTDPTFSSQQGFNPGNTIPQSATIPNPPGRHAMHLI
jgi:hypothetical protein